MSTKIERSGRALTQSFANNPPVGRHADVNGLYLISKRAGQASWVWRGQRNGVRTEFGLGSTKFLKLAQARDMAAEARLALRRGDDPRKALGLVGGEVGQMDWTVNAVVVRLFSKISPTLKDGGRAGRWMSPIEGHILPMIGKMHVSDVDSNAIYSTLKPIWNTKPSVAEKAFQRLRMALLHASDEGAQIDEGEIRKAQRLLGKRTVKAKHIEATAFADVPDLYRRLCEKDQTRSVLALRLAILTVQRLKPVRLAELHQFELNNALWVIPAENLKGQLGKTDEFRCPLSHEAIDVVLQASKARRGDVLFPAQRGDGFISDRGIEKILDRMNEKGRPHGFRSAFGDWTGAKEVPFDLAERCLQHVVGSKVARAYRRSDQLDQRRKIMDDWATFVTTARDLAQRTNLKLVK